MKKIATTLLFIIASAFLFAQTIQIDLSGEELNPEYINYGTKSTFHKQPYLIYEGINSQMRVIWQLSETADCEIFWGEDDNYSLGSYITSEYNENHQHGYTITNLVPSTKYYYKVEYEDVLVEASFKTAPEASVSELKFFMFGDTRTQAEIHDQVSEAMIQVYTSDPDYQTLTMCTGDLVKFGAVEAQWENQFFSPDHLNIRKRMAEIPSQR